LGAGEGDQHICKACGQAFRIQRRHRDGQGARERRGVRNSGAAQAEGVVN
jgi:hypothetical protein